MCGGGGVSGGGHGDVCVYFGWSIRNCFKDIDDDFQMKTKRSIYIVK